MTATGLSAAPSRSASRLGYLDWLRGFAVLIMVEAHTLDSWLRPADRDTWIFQSLTIVNGVGSALFLFLAGVAVVLSAGSKTRNSGSDAAGAAAVRRRGWEIFALAFLLRLQSFVLNPGSPAIGILKVDILNVMGLSIVAAAYAWHAGRTMRAKFIMFACVTLAIAMVTPIVRIAEWLNWIPDPIEWYLRPSPGRANFVMFPWAAFVFGGGIVGVLIDAARDRHASWKRAAAFAGAGAAIALAGYSASLLPSIYERANFWTTSPTFFVMRLGILIGVVGVVIAGYAYKDSQGWSPLEQLGRASLFIYWIHLEMVYGWLSAPLHKRLTLGQAASALALLILFLYGLAMVKNALVARFKASRTPNVSGASLQVLARK
jgi:uncharacterized membrane protein